MKLNGLLFFMGLSIFSVRVGWCMKGDAAHYQPISAIIVANSPVDINGFLQKYCENKDLNQALPINGYEDLVNAFRIYISLSSTEPAISQDDLSAIAEHLRIRASSVYGSNKEAIDSFIEELDSTQNQLLQQIITNLELSGGMGHELDVNEFRKNSLLRNIFCDPRIAVPVVFVVVIIFIIIPAAVLYYR